MKNREFEEKERHPFIIQKSTIYKRIDEIAFKFLTSGLLVVD